MSTGMSSRALGDLSLPNDAHVLCAKCYVLDVRRADVLSADERRADVQTGDVRVGASR